MGRQLFTIVGIVAFYNLICGKYTLSHIYTPLLHYVHTCTCKPHLFAICRYDQTHIINLASLFKNCTA